MIRGFAFCGYRSFYSDRIAVLASLGKINLIVGQNNSGKSNVLREIERIFGEDKQLRSIGDWDRPQGEGEHKHRCYLSVSRHEAVSRAIEAKPKLESLSSRLESFMSSMQDPPGAPESSDSELWVGIEEKGAVSSNWIEEVSRATGAVSGAQSLSKDLTSQWGGPPEGDTQRVLAWLFRGKVPVPSAYLVQGVRAISEQSTEAPDLNGRSIKRRLLELQNPSSNRLGDKEVFYAVQEFVRAVMDDSTVTIDVPHDLSTIHVTQSGRTLPIEHVGTGIHEVVIVAAAASIVRDSIMCIEEPEVHLHPILQRKLLRYLWSSTTNQYFFATHSAHMLDSELGSIFHVTRVGGRSTISCATSARDRSAICSDLGYRPSDLVQTNAVLWVEGPSDRIYLKHWIDVLAPGRFLEGVHYSIMFYGGSLLSELSPLDVADVDDFISLRALNRYMAIIIDSDKSSATSELNATKQRVIEGLSSDLETSLAWVTDGYTIENYVPERILSEAICEAHPSCQGKSFTAMSQWANPLSEERLGLRSVSKVAIAKCVVRSWTKDWPFDLEPQVKGVIELIERANNLG